MLTPLLLGTAAASGSCLATNSAPVAEQPRPSPSVAHDDGRDESNSQAELSSHAIHCDGDWVCIDPVQTENLLSFFVENRRPVPITLTLRIDANQVHGQDRRVVTATVDGDSRENFLTLTADNPATDIRYRYRFDWTVGSLDATHDDRYVYRLPYASGSSYRVLQTYGSRFSHTGYERYAIDFNMREGTPVYAARGGVVARLVESHDKGCWADGCSAYANFVVVLHDDGTTSEYYHLQQGGVLVEEGERVQPGQEIARSGNTGHTTMPHLHFAVYKAASWGNTQSIPVRFATTAGVIERPRRGGAYVAP